MWGLRCRVLWLNCKPYEDNLLTHIKEPGCLFCSGFVLDFGSISGMPVGWIHPVLQWPNLFCPCGDISYWIRCGEIVVERNSRNSAKGPTLQTYIQNSQVATILYHIRKRVVRTKQKDVFPLIHLFQRLLSWFHYHDRVVLESLTDLIEIRIIAMCLFIEPTPSA